MGANIKYPEAAKKNGIQGTVLVCFIVNTDGSIEEKPDEPGFARIAANQIDAQKMNHFNFWDIPGAQVVATWCNRIQR